MLRKLCVKGINGYIAASAGDKCGAGFMPDLIFSIFQKFLKYGIDKHVFV